MPTKKVLSSETQALLDQFPPPLTRFLIIAGCAIGMIVVAWFLVETGLVS
jgi:hypothetical protein